jgi:hypothetical protein
LVAAFALVAIPTFVGVRSYVARAETPAPQFIDSPRYVHANTAANQHDIAAEIEFFPGTTQVKLEVDNVPVPDEDVDDPTEPSTLSSGNMIRLRMPFTPGGHTITGTATVDGQKVAIRGSDGKGSGTAIVYAIDAPALDYIVPTPSKRSFNSNVSPVQVKIDNEFDQFKNLEFSLYTGAPGDAHNVKINDFTLSRDQCDLKQIVGSAICDITKASNWKKLDEGMYFVKLKSSTKAEDGQHADGISPEDDKAWSLSFTIDDTAPTATIEGPLSVIGGENITVKGKIDPSASEATLYVDGDAKGLAARGENDTWSYDLKADLTIGDHKVKLVAKDPADNTNALTIDTATTALTVNPFIPSKADVQQVNDAAVGLTTPFPVPQALTKEDIPPAPVATNSDMAVLGAQDAMNSKIDQEKVIAAVAPSGEGWKLFGVAWFWWFLGAISLIGISSWALASRRQYAMEHI